MSSVSELVLAARMTECDIESAWEKPRRHSGARTPEFVEDYAESLAVIVHRKASKISEDQGRLEARLAMQQLQIQELTRYVQLMESKRFDEVRATSNLERVLGGIRHEEAIVPEMTFTAADLEALSSNDE